MSVESDFIWMDGELVPYADANVHVLSHTLHYGMGVFEGIRSYTQPDGRGGVFRLDEHLQRLLDSATMCRMKVPWTLEQLRDASLRTLAANNMSNAYLRPLVFFGHGKMGLGARDNTVHTAIAVWSWGAYLGEEGLRRGIRAGTSSFTRHHPNSSLQRAKVVGQYVNSILARYEANDNGFDEAIMLDHTGLVAEGTGENLSVIKNGRCVTPPVTNILGGITRATAIEVLSKMGIEVIEQTFGRDALYVADEIFMSGTAAEITPVREIDHRTIGRGSAGPISLEVQGTYLAGVRGEVDWMKPYITSVPE